MKLQLTVVTSVFLLLGVLPLQALCSIADLDCDSFNDTKLSQFNDRSLQEAIIDANQTLATIQGVQLKIPYNIVVYTTPHNKIGSAIGALYCKKNQSTNIMTLYMSAEVAEDGLSLRSALAHEFMHYYVDKNHLNLPRWIDEGIAIYVQTKIYPSSTRNMIRAHLYDYPGISLAPSPKVFSNWSDLKKLSFYGGSYLFINYLVKNYGENIIDDLLSSPNLSWKERLQKSILNSHGVILSFEQIFRDFTIARIANTYDYFGDKNSFYRYFITDDLSMNFNLLVNRAKFVSADTGGPLSFQTPNFKNTDSKLSNKNLIYINISPVGEVQWYSAVDPKRPKHSVPIEIEFEPPQVQK